MHLILRHVHVYKQHGKKQPTKKIAALILSTKSCVLKIQSFSPAYLNVLTDSEALNSCN